LISQINALVDWLQFDLSAETPTTKKYCGFVDAHVDDLLPFQQALSDATEYVLANTTPTDITIQIIATALLTPILFMPFGLQYANVATIQIIQDTKTTAAAAFKSILAGRIFPFSLLK